MTAFSGSNLGPCQHHILKPPPSRMCRHNKLQTHLSQHRSLLGTAPRNTAPLCALARTATSRKATPRKATSLIESLSTSKFQFHWEVLSVAGYVSTVTVSMYMPAYHCASITIVPTHIRAPWPVSRTQECFPSTRLQPPRILA